MALKQAVLILLGSHILHSYLCHSNGSYVHIRMYICMYVYTCTYMYAG